MAGQLTKQRILRDHVTKVLEEADDEISVGAEIMQALFDWVIDGSVVTDMALLQVDQKFAATIWEELVYSVVTEFEDRIARLDEE